MDARHDAADLEVRRDVPVLEPPGGAAGFVGGHVALPEARARRRLRRGDAEARLRAARDEARRRSTTQGAPRQPRDAARAGRRRQARAREDGGELLRSSRSARPAPRGSACNEILRYVRIELASGQLPNGKPYSRRRLLARREPQVAIGEDQTYGMGLEVNTNWGVPIVHHGGDMIGFHSDMIWLPEARRRRRDPHQRRHGSMLRAPSSGSSLEVLFDGDPRPTRRSPPAQAPRRRSPASASGS